MSGAILRKAVKDVPCEKWGWVSGRVISLCNINVTKVAEFGSGVRMRMLGLVAGSEEVSNSNMMTDDMSKAPSKIIYIEHHFYLCGQ